MSDQGTPVQLYIYDLSQGMARMLSLQLTGKQIDGIWHTSVVVYGREYYFGQGILVARPGSTHHGAPLQVVDMGRTHIPEDVFLEFIEALKPIWTADKYHLLDNNCNSFSNEVCNFLVGKDIPSHITGLPADFLSTPFGQSLLPMLQNMFGPSQLAQRLPSPATALPSATPPPPAQQQPSAPAVRSVASLSQFDAILTSNRCVAVDFTSANCGPCRVISPEFERLIDEYERNFQPKGILVGTRNSQKIVGVKVEVGMAREIAARYNISVTPTFVFFLDGKQFHDFKGANPQELKTSIELLLFTAYPPHPHVKVKTPTLDKFPSAPILYTQSTNLKAIFTKLAEFTAQHSVTMDSSVLDGIRDGLQAKHETKVKETLVLPGRWAATVSGLLDDLPTEQLFPLLDIVRLLVLDDGVRDHYVRDKDATLMKIMYRCGGGQSQPEELPKAVRLMALRLACNLFASPTSTTYLLSLTRTIPPSSTPHRSVVTALLIETLLSADASVRQGAASLAFNIAVTEAKYRDSGSGGVEGQEEEEGMHEEWVAELVAAVAKAVEVEEDDEIVLRLLASLCHLLRYAPAPIIQLAAVVGVEAAVDAKRAKREGLPGAGVTADEKLKKEADKRAKVVGLCSEVAELVKVGGGQA